MIDLPLFPLVEGTHSEVLDGLGPYTACVNDPPWSTIAPAVAPPARIIDSWEMDLGHLESLLDGNCAYELLESARGHFDPYGNIITGVCSGITVGDSQDMDAAYSTFELEDRPILNALCTTGVKGLCEMAVSEYDFTPKETYPGKCSLCMDIRRHLVTFGAEFDELRPKEFYARV